MKDGVHHKAEEIVITKFSRFPLDDNGDEHKDDKNTIDCNSICIQTFVIEKKESLARCADTTAPKSMIDKKQMERVLDILGSRCTPAIRSKRVFRFGDVSAKSLGIIELAIQITNNIPPMYILLNKVDVDKPAYIGLDVLDGNFLKVDNISNRLWHRIAILNDPLEILHKWWVPVGDRKCRTQGSRDGSR